MTLTSLLMFSCEKPADDNKLLLNEVNEITLRSGNQEFSGEVEAIKTDILAKSTYQQIQTDKFLNGQLVFDQMELLFVDNEQKLFSIPKIKNAQVHSVLLVHYSAEGMKYRQAHYSMFESDFTDTESNFDGINDIALFSSLFIHHEKKYNGMLSINIVKAFTSDEVQNSFTDIQTRGWCLMEVELTQENTDIDWETWLDA